MTKEQELKKVAILDDITQGILSGYLKNGAPFSLLEFWKQIPFKYPEVAQEVSAGMNNTAIPIYRYEDFVSIINNFTWMKMPKANFVIMKYMNLCKSHVYGHHFPSDIRDFNHVKEVLYRHQGEEYADITFGNEATDEIIDYMVTNDIPLMLETFQYVKGKHLAGSLTSYNGRQLSKQIKNN